MMQNTDELRSGLGELRMTAREKERLRRKELYKQKRREQRELNLCCGRMMREAFPEIKDTEGFEMLISFISEDAEVKKTAMYISNGLMRPSAGAPEKLTHHLSILSS